MNIKEAYEYVANAAYLGSEEDQKKHEEALKVIKDNLELNQYVSTDIAKNYYDNVEWVYEKFYGKHFKLSYEDFLAISKMANEEIGKNVSSTDIHSSIYIAIRKYIEDIANKSEYEQ